ncbi:MAG: Xaa-Pro peptidase family protein [Acidobacteria bacterium]|nr:Xaa-Pro peptidase family protein [Acidobacteriota bacterium]
MKWNHLATTLLLMGACLALVRADDFADRRAALKKGTYVLLGTPEQDGETRDGFFQEPNFYYLTGLRDPGGAVMITDGVATIYLDKRNAKREVWTGRKLAFEDQPALGATLKPMDTLAGDLAAVKGKVFTLPELRPRLQKLASGLEFEDASPSLQRLRMRKSAGELAIMQKAIDASIAAHKASWKVVRPGLYEYELANAMSSVYFSRGCERHAYAPIVGSGPNGTVLHYFRNSRRMDAGELVLMDVGAECSGYAGDITRTVPVNGKFTPRQREIYEAVLKAEKAVIAAAKPGATIKQLKQVAIDTLNKHRQPLGDFMIHGVSHHIGLDVHDFADNDVPLAAGAVITVEPGVYLPKESLGIRIEDMILITEQGSVVLTADLPKEAAEIEKIMAQEGAARGH